MKVILVIKLSSSSCMPRWFQVARLSRSLDVSEFDGQRNGGI